MDYLVQTWDSEPTSGGLEFRSDPTTAQATVKVKVKVKVKVVGRSSGSLFDLMILLQPSALDLLLRDLRSQHVRTRENMSVSSVFRHVLWREEQANSRQTWLRFADRAFSHLADRHQA